MNGGGGQHYQQHQQHYRHYQLHRAMVTDGQRRSPTRRDREDRGRPEQSQKQQKPDEQRRRRPVRHQHASPPPPPPPQSPPSSSVPFSSLPPPLSSPPTSPVPRSVSPEGHHHQHHRHHNYQHRSKNRPTIVELSDEALPAALAADGYRLGSTVGHGSYSKVRVATRSLPDHTAARVACKIINKMREADSSYVRKFLPRELQVLCAVRHPNVVRTHRIYATPSTVHVFMDYCENGDLLNYLQNSKGIPLWQAQTFFKQITEAVDYLHRNEISHRDIKCENVLLESMRHVKLTDFGFTRLCADERGRRLFSQTFCGSSSYAAPEVLQGIPYDPKAYDVWALGVVLYVMLADTMPYPYSNRQQIVANQMAKKFAKPKKFVSREAIRLIS